MVAAMMMLMMIMRLCLGHSLVAWDGERVQAFPLPWSCSQSQGCEQECHLEADTLDLARWWRRSDPEPNLLRMVRLDAPFSVSPRA